MSFLSLSMLGVLQVSLDDRAVEGFEYNKVKGLLAYLAVEADRPHHREVLAEIFWPDRPAQSARNSLRQALSILRNAINDREEEIPFLMISRDNVQFNRKSNYWLDVQVFLDSIHQCREALRRGPDAGPNCIHWLKQATRLYRGDFLDQFLLNDSDQFSDWVALRRDEYRRMALEAMDMLAAHHEKEGDLEESRRYAFRQLELDPLREEAHRRVMRINVQKGNRSDALAQYESCRRALAQELGVEPEEETRNLLKKILELDREEKNEFTAPANLVSHPHSLPRETETILGREDDVARIGTLLLDQENRGVIVFGPDGIGKTSLALRAGQEYVEHFSDGVFFVDLSSIGETENIITQVAGALDLLFYGSIEPYMQLVNHLRDKKILLILDSLDTLPDAGRILDQVFSRTPGVKIIGTARHSIENLPGESYLLDRGLSYPDRNEDRGEHASSVYLFVRSARRGNPDFQLADDTRDCVWKICSLLRGHPLSIELVSTWTRVLPCQEIAGRIEERLHSIRSDENSSGENTYEEIFRAVAAISWEFLSTYESEAFQKLAVFAGGFRRDAAEEIADANLPVLSSLSSKSFLSMEAGGRFHPVQALIRFAGNEFRRSEEDLFETRRLHANFFSSFLNFREESLSGTGQSQAIQAISADLGNIRRAWRFAVNEGRILYLEKSHQAMAMYFEMTGLYREGMETFSSAAFLFTENIREGGDISENSIKRLQGQLLATEGWFHLLMENLREARSRIRQGLKILGEARVETGLAWPYFYMGALSIHLEKDSDASSYLEKSLSLHVKSGNMRGVSLANYYLGMTRVARKTLEEARGFFNESVRISQEIGETRLESRALERLAEIARREDRLEDCRRLYGECLAIFEESGDRQGLARVLGALGDLHLHEKDPEGAARSYHRSMLLYRQLYIQPEVVRSLNRMGSLSYTNGDYQAARRYYDQALEMAIQRGLLGSALESLLGHGMIQDLEGDDRQALEVYRLVQNHEVASEDLKEKARELLRDLESRYTREEMEALEGEERMFEEVVQTYLERGLGRDRNSPGEKGL